MEKPPTEIETPWWHSLMYSTSILLIVGGIPATILLALSPMDESGLHLGRAEALWLGIYMIAAEVAVAVILFVGAEWFWRRRVKERSAESAQKP